MKENTFRVLVAEDHPVNQKVLGWLLNRLGIESDCVSDGLQAVEATKCDSYALILMDCMMPVMDGFQAAFEIRGREFGRGLHTPIIACTAMDKDRIFNQCILAGMDDYIAKPIDRDLLAEKIECWSRISLMLPRSAPRLTQDGRQLETSREADPIDRQYLNLLYSLQQLDDVLELFLTVTETLLAQLESAIEHHDVAVVHRMAHEIKGSSYAVSAREMAKLCLELEQAGQEQKWTEAEKLYTSLGLAFARVREFLSEKQKLVS